jgi:heme/copper-type cytochrome/quinol oxidase subunit 2
MPPSLADAIFWVAAVCCAIAQWFILRGALAVSGVARTGDAMPPARRGLELVWAVLPAIALALVLVATWRALHPARPAPAAAAVAPAPVTR